jgi:hypothetical protein
MAKFGSGINILDPQHKLLIVEAGKTSQFLLSTNLKHREQCV